MEQLNIAKETKVRETIEENKKNQSKLTEILQENDKLKLKVLFSFLFYFLNAFVNLIYK